MHTLEKSTSAVKTALVSICTKQTICIKQTTYIKQVCIQFQQSTNTLKVTCIRPAPVLSTILLSLRCLLITGWTVRNGQSHAFVSIYMGKSNRIQRVLKLRMIVIMQVLKFISEEESTTTPVPTTTVPPPNHVLRSRVATFRFFDSKKLIIHCDVKVCEIGDSDCDIVSLIISLLLNNVCLTHVSILSFW